MKASKETKNNYRKSENQSQHNDFPICGKNKKRKRNTKGIDLHLLLQNQAEVSGSIPDHIERSIPEGFMYLKFYISYPGMTAFRPIIKACIKQTIEFFR